MKQKKVICLLATIVMLTGMQSLAIQTVKVKKTASGTEVYSYITNEEYDIARNNSLIKMEKICVAPKKHTTMKIAILNDFDDKNVELHIDMICMGVKSTELFDVVITMGKHITEHSSQVSFLNELIMRILLVVIRMLALELYEGYFCISQFVYIMHNDLSFEDNMKQYRKVFHSISFVMAEREKCIRQLLIHTDWMYLTLNGKWIQKHCDIIIYVEKSKKSCVYGK